MRARNRGEASTKNDEADAGVAAFKRPQELEPDLLYSLWFFIGYWILHEAGFLSGLFLWG